MPRPRLPAAAALLAACGASAQTQLSVSISAGAPPVHVGKSGLAL